MDNGRGSGACSDGGTSVEWTMLDFELSTPFFNVDVAAPTAMDGRGDAGDTVRWTCGRETWVMDRASGWFRAEGKLSEFNFLLGEVGSIVMT